MSKPNNRFVRGQSVYQCRCCGRKTRQTGNGDNENVELCEQCYDLAGLENAVLNGETLRERDRETIKALKAFIASKGGKDAFPSLGNETKQAKTTNLHNLTGHVLTKAGLQTAEKALAQCSEENQVQECSVETTKAGVAAMTVNPAGVLMLSVSQKAPRRAAAAKQSKKAEAQEPKQDEPNPEPTKEPEMTATQEPVNMENTFLLPAKTNKTWEAHRVQLEINGKMTKVTLAHYLKEDTYRVQVWGSDNFALIGKNEQGEWVAKLCRIVVRFAFHQVVQVVEDTEPTKPAALPEQAYVSAVESFGAALLH